MTVGRKQKATSAGGFNFEVSSATEGYLSSTELIGRLADCGCDRSSDLCFTFFTLLFD